MSYIVSDGRETGEFITDDDASLPLASTAQEHHISYRADWET